MATNRLANEKSPYLLQHAHNPVDWYAWSDEAFERARQEDKPIFLSIGYATCHWCHVMERESFEDDEAARHLNETFVCIKVDREERPDIDAVYMSACQMLTGAGGWPLTLLLTADKTPFFAATYIPKNNRFGRMGLVELCGQVKALWRGDRSKVLDSADRISQALQKAFDYTPGDEVGMDSLDAAHQRLAQSYDAEFGGFDSAPKFPTAHRFLFLLRHYHRTHDPQALEMVTATLTAMRRGGIWDHVGLGFHRYATDRNWLLPHFEKMLYDQALLALAYLEAFQVTGDGFFAGTAREIFSYVLRDMTSPEGGFYAAEDADSEGEEGRFYVWQTDEFQRVLGSAEAAVWEKVFALEVEGNFADESTREKTGANILHLAQPMEAHAEAFRMPVETLQAHWQAAREKLFAARETRIHPLKDDKILTDWNGLMIAALAAGSRVLADPDLATAARRAARFIFARLQASDGRLLHRYREGEAGIGAHADDYAFLIWGLLELYAATFDVEDLQRAIDLQTMMIADFWDAERGGFFSAAENSDQLPVRPKELYDGALPSANSVTFGNLLNLERLTGDARWAARAAELMRAFSGSVKAQPSIFTHFLCGVDFALGSGREVVIVGDPGAGETREMIAALNHMYAPHARVLLKTETNAAMLETVAPFTAKLDTQQGSPAAYVCSNFICRWPAPDAATLISKMGGGR